MAYKNWILPGLLSSLLLGGCTIVGAYDVKNLRSTTAQGGTPFTMALTDEYRAAAIEESEKEYEWDDAGIFARKGLRAAKGEGVAPEDLASSPWHVPAGRTAELGDARARLVAALDGGARDRVPGPAAHAQVMFDCWVEEESEGETDSTCRAEFLKTMPLLQVAQATPAPAPADAHIKAYVIYFDFNKSTLTPEGRQIVAQVVADLKAASGSTVRVTGKADRAGTDGYNQKLSERRAKTVTDALAKAGIAAGRINAKAVGEKDPPVATADGVREGRNRVVEITIH